MADHKIADTANVLHLLWQRFDAKNATDEDLDFLSNASEEASSLARIAADAANSASASICDDKQRGRTLDYVNGVRIEDFLYQIANTLSTIGELSEIGDTASYFISERLAAKLNKKSRCVAIDKKSLAEGV